MRGLLFVVLVVGIAEPQIRQHSIVPTLFPFNNRLLLGNSWQKLFLMNKICFQIGSTGKEVEFPVEWELPKDKIKAETAIALSIQQLLSDINKYRPTNR